MLDQCQGETSLSNATSLDHWNRMVRAFLAHGKETPEHLGALLTAEPDFAMGYAVKGLFCLLLGRREMVATAQEAYAAAKSANTGSAREADLVRALGCWLDGRPSQSIALIEGVLHRNPADSLAMKLGQAIRFVMGDGIGMRRSVERVLHAHGDGHPYRGFALGCHAFTLEETSDYAGAEAAALQGLSYASDDAWGLHAVAHVYDMTGQSKKGIEVIDSHSGTWLGCNNFRYHVWWHKALLHLDLGDTDAVLALYDGQIRGDKTDDYRDIANASSLLMRLALEGVNVGDRWDELADISERRLEDACLAFADLHYLLALIGGDRQVAIAKLLGRLEHTKVGPREGEFAQVLASPGYACALGLAAFAEGNFGDAFATLNGSRGLMQSIGGSHAQRDVFERLTIEAGIRAGQFEAAEALLIGRKTLRFGKDDRFSAHRREAIAAARHERYSVAAQ